MVLIENALTKLRKGVFNLFILMKLRSAVHVEIGYVNNVSIKLPDGIDGCHDE